MPRDGVGGMQGRVGPVGQLRDLLRQRSRRAVGRQRGVKAAELVRPADGVNTKTGLPVAAASPVMLTLSAVTTSASAWARKSP